MAMTGASERPCAWSSSGAADDDERGIPAHRPDQSASKDRLHKAFLASTRRSSPSPGTTWPRCARAEKPPMVPQSPRTCEEMMQAKAEATAAGKRSASKMQPKG
jgi:hypothetical protein